MKYLLSVAVVALFLFSAPASAVTECNVTPARFFVGDGMLWVNWVEGGAGKIHQSDTDFNATLAVVSLAITSGKPMVVRYASDGFDCSTLGDISGVWILR